MQSFLKVKFKNEQIFLKDHIYQKKRDVVLTYTIF